MVPLVAAPAEVVDGNDVFAGPATASHGLGRGMEGGIYETLFFPLFALALRLLVSPCFEVAKQQAVRQSVISRSRPALTSPPALNPAPPLPF